MDGANNFITEKLVELAKTNPLEVVKALVTVGVGENYEQATSEFRELDGDTILGLTLDMVHEEGGYEGGGEHAEFVMAIKHDKDILFHVRYCGFYYSYDGTTWDELSEGEIVEPREVVVTQYFAVDGSDD
jgi:hypothetical protein